MGNTFSRRWTASTAILLCLSLSACSALSLRSAELEHAKRQYEKASKDPEIVRRASDHLDFARDALEKAESRRSRDSEAPLSHYVYLFEQHMRIASLAVERGRSLDKLEARSGPALMAAEPVYKPAFGNRQIEGSGELDWDRLLAAAHAATSDRMSTGQAVDNGSGEMMALSDVLFNLDKATLAAGSEETIVDMVRFLNRHADRLAVIEGHTDNSGSTQYNRMLSRDRAFAVQEALVRAGISADRLAVRGLGESDPVASNEQEFGRRLNRRVNVVLRD